VRPDRRTEELIRELAPAVLGALSRRYGHFDACEDAVQEALLAAARQWPEAGVPDNPRGWLITIASRRLIDQLRSDRARRAREETGAALLLPADPIFAAAADQALERAQAADRDDSLTLLFLCCHPALPPPSQVALTLRSVGGLTTAEIARAFLVPEATMAQRISRAKQRIREAGIPFQLPPEGERPQRLRAVESVLYLIFNEGYTATSGASLARTDLSDEAIWLARMLHRLQPDDGEVAGLLALMLLTDARRPARSGPDGAIVPLDEQDRSLWQPDMIAEGVALVSAALARSRIGPYQLQAAIAAVHDEAASAAETDWAQILDLYNLLEALAGPPASARHPTPFPSPVFRTPLNASPSAEEA
jgi:RNA polymerase sigma factor (sigma-70 family)